MSKEKWVQMVPIPVNAGPPKSYPDFSEPSQTWMYRDKEGRRIGFIYRFDRQDEHGSHKDYRPLAYFRNERTGRHEWRRQAFDKPRPLYGLERLAVHPKTPVLLVEGEKTTDAADRLIGNEFVCITWPGGSKAVRKIDFSTLKGRQVIVWPDNDEPGFNAALAVADVLSQKDGKAVEIVVPPDDKKAGWDLADAEEEDWDAEQVLQWIDGNCMSPDQFRLFTHERFHNESADTSCKAKEQVVSGDDLDDLDSDSGQPPFLPPPPEFPPEVLPEQYRQLVEQTAKTFSVPVTIPVVALFALASTCIGRSRGIMVKPGWVEHANLYLALVARSGIGKTPCTQAFFQSLFNIEHENYLCYELEMADYKQRVEKIKRSSKKERRDVLPEKPQLLQFYIDDATIESVSEALVGNLRGVLWFQDELAGLLKSMGRYSPKGDDGSIKSRLNSAHSCVAWKTNRKTSGVVNIRYACLSIFGTIQPEVLPQIFSDQDAVSGFLPRFLFVRVEAESPQLFSEEVFGEDHQETLRQLTRKLLSLDFDGEGNPINIELGVKAKVEYVSWHDRQAMEQWSSADGNLIESCLAKLRAHCLRLCLILHILEAMALNHDEAESISAETMRRAILLTDWFKEHQKQVLRFMDRAGKVCETSPLERRVMMAVLALEGEIKKGMIPTSKITEKVNEEVEDTFKITSVVVGKCCGTLGLGVGRKMPDGQSRGVVVTEKNLSSFRKALNLPVRSVRSVPNVDEERISLPDSKRNCRPSRPAGNDQVRTARTEEKSAVLLAEPCGSGFADTSDGSDGKKNGKCLPQPKNDGQVQRPEGEWVPFGTIDKIKNKKLRGGIAKALLDHGNDGLKQYGIDYWVDPSTRDTYLLLDTLPELN